MVKICKESDLLKNDFRRRDVDRRREGTLRLQGVGVPHAGHLAGAHDLHAGENIFLHPRGKNVDNVGAILVEVVVV